MLFEWKAFPTTKTKQAEFNLAKEQSMKKFLILLVFVSLFSVPLMAQDNAKVEVFGGYQYLHTGSITISGTTIPNSSEDWNGWNAAASYYFNKYLGVTGDFSGNYKTISGVSGHVYTYTGGPVVAYREGKLNPYVHALFGGIHLSGSALGSSASIDGFTMAFGGGVDYQVHKHVSVRPIQADWIYYHFGSQTVASVAIPSFSQSNNVRISTGIVFRF